MKIYMFFFNWGQSRKVFYIKFTPLILPVKSVKSSEPEANVWSIFPNSIYKSKSSNFVLHYIPVLQADLFLSRAENRTEETSLLIEL